MDRHESFDPAAALERAEQVGANVRRRGRWHGWVWLTIGLASPVLLVVTATDVVEGPVRMGTAIGFMLLAGLLAVWETRRGLWGRQAARTDRATTAAYVVTMAVAALTGIVGEVADAPAWYMALAALPAVPCFIAAWRILAE